MNTSLILVIVGSFFLFLIVRRMRGGWITSDEAHGYVATGAKLLDVRTPAEFRGGHIQGAVNIPLDQLAGRTSELGPKASPIVVYCRSGNRSGTASRALRQAGFTAVYDLGPQSRW